MSRTLTLLAALMIGAAAPALSHETVAGDLQIIHASIPQPAEGAKNAAGYMGIANTGTVPDRLIGVTVGFAGMAELHLSATDANGVATMTPVEAIDVPPGETVLLEPGGLHVMLMGLTVSPREGDLLPATLTFEKAGPVAIEFMVDPPGGADHSGHGADGAGG